MKVNFVRVGEPHIEGYVRAEALGDLNQFANSECDTIFANNILDSFSLHGAYEAISLMRSKLRMGGALVIGGTDLRLFCKSVINGSISSEDGSQLVASCGSMHESNKVKHYLQQLGLVIDTSSIQGTHYEFKATRPNG